MTKLLFALTLLAAASVAAIWLVLREMSDRLPDVEPPFEERWVGV